MEAEKAKSSSTTTKSVTMSREFKITSKTSPVTVKKFVAPVITPVQPISMPVTESRSLASTVGDLGMDKVMRARILSPERRSYSGGSLTPVVSIRDSREREKKEMCELNDRFANYIEKVRFLDAQNRKMQTDLGLVRARMGKESVSTRAMFEGEIAEAKKVANMSESERKELEKEIPLLGAQINEFKKMLEDAQKGHSEDRKTINQLIEQFSNVEGELNLLRRRISESEEEVVSLKKLNQTYISSQGRYRTEKEQESLARIDHQNRVQMLLEELDFIRREQEQELNDLHALAIRDTTPENQEYFKNELAEAIRGIRNEYDQITNNNRADLESWYSLKVQELASATNRQSLEQGYSTEESKRLRNQLADLRAKLAKIEGRNSLLEKQVVDLNVQIENGQKTYRFSLEDRDSLIVKLSEQTDALAVELQNLIDQKKSLEEEIAIYRKLLEGEETRAGLRKIAAYSHATITGPTIEHVEEQVVHSAPAESYTTHEKITRIQYHSTAKTDISIQQVDDDGAFIILENTNHIDQVNIGNWKLKKSVKGGGEVVFTFPKDFTLQPLKTVIVWARDQGGKDSPPDQIICKAAVSFGTSVNARTSLSNAVGEEVATVESDSV